MWSRRKKTSRMFCSLFQRFLLSDSYSCYITCDFWSDHWLAPRWKPFCATTCDGHFPLGLEGSVEGEEVQDVSVRLFHLPPQQLVPELVEGGPQAKEQPFIVLCCQRQCCQWWLTDENQRQDFNKWKMAWFMPLLWKPSVSFPTVWALMASLEIWWMEVGIHEYVQNTAPCDGKQPKCYCVWDRQMQWKWLSFLKQRHRSFLGEILSWLFLPFLISTCFNIRTDVNGVQRRTRKEFVARV